MSRKKRNRKQKTLPAVSRSLEENQKVFQQFVLPMKEEIYVLVQKNIKIEQYAEEVYQEIFSACWEALPCLRDLSRSREWVYRIARRKISDHYRALERNPEITFAEMKGQPNPKYAEFLICEQEDGDFVKYLLSEDRMDLVWRAFENLEENYRGIIWLRYSHHWSLKEVAGELGMNYNTVRVMFSRGMKKLKEQYRIIQEEEEADE